MAMCCVAVSDAELILNCTFSVLKRNVCVPTFSAIVLSNSKLFSHGAQTCFDLFRKDVCCGTYTMFFLCVLSTHTPVGPMPLLLGKHDCAEGSTAVKT